MPLIGQDLHTSEPLLRAVISTAVDGIMIIDERGVVRLYNAACERLFGYTAEEVIGRNVKMLMPKPYRAEHDSYLKAYRKSGEARIIGIGREVTGQRKDGSLFPIGLSVGEAVLGDDRYFVGIVHDITEQKLNEEKLRTAVKAAESANRAKSDFLAVMSHEIRTPLHGILATTSLLLHTELAEKQVQYAETIQQSGEGLLDVVNNILDLAKIEAGIVVVKEARFELKELLESVEFLWESRIREKELEYFTQIGRDMPSAVIGDADRIREILNNLINNAVKFTEQGYIAVKVGVGAEAKARGKGRVVLRFEVKDTGIGIDSKQQARLFERFEQGDASFTRTHGGSGLGLAICKELSELLGGEIGVISEPDKGSRFWFTVSCKVADKPKVRPKQLKRALQDAQKAKALKPLTVLVAEDNHTNQVILRDILEHHGHIVDIAPNGREAVRAVMRRSYDLILMDIRMPIMDGLEATRRIREELPGTVRVPIIALTAHAMNGVRGQCLAAGMDDYISKPFTISQLNDMVLKYAEAA